MKRTFLFLLLSFLSIHVFAQKQGMAKIDSLQAVLKTAKEDTNKVNVLNEIAREFMNFNPDTSIVLSSGALQLAKKLNWQLGIGKSHHSLGVFSWMKGDFSLSLEHYSKALAMCD